MNENLSSIFADDSSEQLDDFSSVNYLEVTVFCMMFFIGAPANLYVAFKLAFGRKYASSRHEMLLLNLAVADTIVLVLVIPTEIFWRLTASWVAAVYYPFKYQTCDKTIKKLLVLAWVLSALFSSPQAILFVVVSHPNYPEFDQCVSIDLLKSESTMRLYNIFCISITYFIPLVVISISYVLICLKIRTNAARKCIREAQSETALSVRNVSQSEANNPTKRTPQTTNRSRRIEIKKKIVKDTVIVLAAFIVCWTPYATIHLWYQIDRESAKYLDKNVTGILFLFAISNSCVNPYIYGKIVPSKCFL